MSYKIKLSDIDCIFLSYDEPNAEYNYADLLTKVPWAKRVHGIKGSDAAHKACADISDTEHFITVDGDNIVDSKLFDHEIDFNTLPTLHKSQVSWSARNHINGLIYGNGGIKCWTREHVWNMRTHEAAKDDTNQVDFCWAGNYHHMDGCFSVVYNNASALQAFRAGFREGVKMSLINGVKLNSAGLNNFSRTIPEQNYQRLLIWCSVGQDVQHGEWAVYGARLGCYMTNLTDWDYTQVKDFGYLNSLFQEQDINRSTELKHELMSRLNLSITDLANDQSKFFKTTYQNLPRSKRLMEFAEGYVTKIKPHESYDIVFISNGEPNAEENFNRLKQQVGSNNRLHRVNNIKGIYNAHKQAASLAKSKMFYVVDADAWIVDTFSFNDRFIDETKSYVFHSVNPVNDLCYGYGAVKVFPTHVFEKEIIDYVDMTTTVSDIEVIPVVSCITRFNTTEFDTWRSAFRECVKLSSKIIDNQDNQDTEKRLNQWITRAYGDHAQHCLQGAQAGNQFGSLNKHHANELAKINDFDFLKRLFEHDSSL